MHRFASPPLDPALGVGQDYLPFASVVMVCRRDVPIEIAEQVVELRHQVSDYRQATASRQVIIGIGFHRVRCFLRIVGGKWKSPDVLTCFTPQTTRRFVMLSSFGRPNEQLTFLGLSASGVQFSYYFRIATVVYYTRVGSIRTLAF